MAVTISTAEFARDLHMTECVKAREDFFITSSDINLPGLQFTGYYVHFMADRVQLVGNAEMFYLMELSPEVRRTRMEEFFQHENIPLIVIARGHGAPDEMAENARRSNVPVVCTPLTTTRASHVVTHYLDMKLAPTITRHGVLVDVYGVGILLLGESGVGKSETALELIKRSHRLVADDVVDIRRVADDRLVGKAPELTRHLMEIRGIGLIDVRYMYGVGAVIQEKSIDLVIDLEMWNEKKEYDRLGMEDNFVSILGVNITHITIPVRPGRNLAIIVEVAARNFRLKRLGYHTAKEFDRRLMDHMAPSQQAGYDE